MSRRNGSKMLARSARLRAGPVLVTGSWLMRLPASVVVVTQMSPLVVWQHVAGGVLPVTGVGGAEDIFGHGGEVDEVAGGEASPVARSQKQDSDEVFCAVGGAADVGGPLAELGGCAAGDVLHPRREVAGAGRGLLAEIEIR